MAAGIVAAGPRCSVRDLSLYSNLYSGVSRLQMLKHHGPSQKCPISIQFVNMHCGYTVSGSVKSYYTIIHFYLDNVNTITVMTAFHWIAVKLWLYFVLPVTLQLKTKSKYWYFNAGTTLNLCIFIMQCSLIVGLVFNTSSVYIIRVLLLAPLVSPPWIPLVKSVKWNIRPCPYLLNAKLYLPYELYGVFFHNSAFTACFCLL